MLLRCTQCKTPIEVGDNETAFNSCPTCNSRLLAPSAVTEELTVGTKIEHFRLLEMVGEGTYGAVWKAQDEQLDRLVAIKLPRVEAVETAHLLKEARAAARIKHPAIVDVFEIGMYRDRPYIVTEFIDGETLDEWLVRAKPSPESSAEICKQLAEGIHAAHREGVIHRDLKPANVMIDSSGAVHVTDFGIATRDDSEATTTLDGQIIGTPAYMSPEQARGEGNRVDRLTDVYSLGAVLYRLLAGKSPFTGGSHAIIPMVLSQEPEPLDVSIPGELQAICRKAMAKEKSRRYQSAAELAEDLQRFLAGVPVLADRTGATQSPKYRWVGLTGVALVLVAIAGFAWSGATGPADSKQGPLRSLPPVDPSQTDRDDGPGTANPQAASAAPALPAWAAPAWWIQHAQFANKPTSLSPKSRRHCSLATTWLSHSPAMVDSTKLSAQSQAPEDRSGPGPMIRGSSVTTATPSCPPSRCMQQKTSSLTT